MARPRRGGLAADVQGDVSAVDIFVRSRWEFEPGLGHSSSNNNNVIIILMIIIMIIIIISQGQHPEEMPRKFDPLFSMDLRNCDEKCVFIITELSFIMYHKFSIKFRI